MIAYVGSASNCSHGLAVALKDDPAAIYAGATAVASGHGAVGGGVWRLPAIQDWKYMFIGRGNGAGPSATTMNYSCFNSKLATAGTALKSDYYWSSIENLYFNGKEATFDYTDITDGLSRHNSRAVSRSKVRDS